MYQHIAGRLKPYCDDPPKDLVARFSATSLLSAPDLFINLLSLDDSLEYTDGIQDTFIGELLGLIVLDDANNSNPFCYVSRGLVLHLRHDDVSTFAFSSLSHFVDAIRRAIDARQTIDDLLFETEFPIVDQTELVEYLQY